MLKTEKLSVETVIKEVVEAHRPSINKRNHALTVDFEPVLPQVNGDKDRLIQVFSNLLGNAIKFTPDNGQIEIKARRDRGNTILISITDNGIGIDKKHIKKLFNRFYEVVEWTKHTSGMDGFMSGGMGLGLDIVKGIVKAHGGKVWCRSGGKNRGAVFYVSLPAVIDKGKENKKMTIESSGSFQDHGTAIIDKFKVLIMDTGKDTAVAVGDLLGGKFEIMSAETVGRTLKTAISAKPDLIMVGAEHISPAGYDICNALKSNVNTCKIPIIILTNGDDKNAKIKNNVPYADGFISRQFSNDDLVKLVGRFGRE